MDAADVTAAQLSRAYAAQRLSPVEALEACLARVERLNPSLNAIVTLDAAGARAAARASETRWRQGAPLSPLDGVPVTIKDNLLVAGLRASWGSRLYADYVPAADELPVARLRQAGLVILGKTNVPEFTLQGYTDNLLFGPTRNPWNPALTPGGSSGGAVASVAAGMAPLALATDGGGSIRRPVSHTGLFGLKPTVGRIARGQGFPVILHDFEVVGPIARSPRDIDLVMGILAGADARDWASVRWPAWREVEPADRRLRILFVARFGNEPLDPDIARSVGEAADTMTALGHEVELGQCSFDLDKLARIFAVVSQGGLSWLLHPSQERLDELTPAIRAMAEAGFALTAADYVDMLSSVDELKRVLAGLFGRYDALLTPAAAALPWAAERSHPEEIAGRRVGPRGHAIFTPFANASGCPAIAVPGAPSPAGLPIGFQLVAPPGNDEMLVALARAYAAMRPDCMQRPTLAVAA
jgi:aspartyl-tRNA(Asn)/glutamyl-tRNA(Gln) amidotransferase subunit A